MKIKNYNFIPTTNPFLEKREKNKAKMNKQIEILMSIIICKYKRVIIKSV